MTFTILGGDLRSVYLCRRMLRDGFAVRTYGLELADVPDCTRRYSLADALQDADCVVLPTPATDGTLLRTPFGTAPLTIESVADSIPQSARVFGGALGTQVTTALQTRNIHALDLLTIESLAIKNAALTSQGALRLILEHIPFHLMGRPVLIIGAGRIGKLLALQLKALGAAVTVASRKEADKAWCTAFGLGTADTYDLAPHLPNCAVAVNTVPAPVLDSRTLSLLPHDALLLELASKPGGFDHLRAEAMGLQVVQGGGLPGRFTPQSAADAIAETIYTELEGFYG